MSQSLLLDITRESITEVFEAKRTINKDQILKDFPALEQNIAVYVNIYLNNELRGSSGSVTTDKSLLESIVYHAKVAAFEDERFNPLITSEYLQATLELSLLTPLKELNYENLEDIKNAVVPKEDGLVISLGKNQAAFLPQVWTQLSSFDEFFKQLLQDSGLKDLNSKPKVFTFQVEKQQADAILQ